MFSFYRLGVKRGAFFQALGADCVSRKKLISDFAGCSAFKIYLVDDPGKCQGRTKPFAPSAGFCYGART